MDTNLSTNSHHNEMQVNLLLVLKLWDRNECDIVKAVKS